MIVNLSDLAAMGAAPVGVLLALTAPRDARVHDFDGVVAGFVAEAEKAACPLVGGNLSHGPAWTLAVTIVGRCDEGRALTRGGLRPGDELFVTGTLGGAALARLRADATGAPLRRLPTPRLAAGRRLARRPDVVGCIDLSDGLATDLAHLLGGRGLGAEIDPAALPRPRGFEAGCRALGLDPLQVIALGGEDYELLFALRSQRKGSRATRKRVDLGVPMTRRTRIDLGVPVTRIGTVTGSAGLVGLPTRVKGHHF